jgi:hypothetical protein
MTTLPGSENVAEKGTPAGHDRGFWWATLLTIMAVAAMAVLGVLILMNTTAPS